MLNKITNLERYDVAKATRKLVCGVGINDADYQIARYEFNGLKSVRVWLCPFYKVWQNMLQRCYNEKSIELHPSYQGCYTALEWHYFMAFRAWMIQQDWEVKELDKDLLVPGNKIYGPDTCVFISSRINLFLTDRASDRGEWPIGVGYQKSIKRFTAKCGDAEGKRIYLGVFQDPQEAHQAWLKFKLEQAHILAAEQSDPRVAKALIDRYENYHIYFPQAR